MVRPQVPLNRTVEEATALREKTNRFIFFKFQFFPMVGFDLCPLVYLG